MAKNNNVVSQLLQDKKTLLALILFIALNVAFIVLSVVKLDIPVVSVCVIAVLESVLIALLKNVTVLVHLVIVALQVICGFVAGQGVFMILMALIYVGALCVTILSGRSK